MPRHSTLSSQTTNKGVATHLIDLKLPQERPYVLLLHASDLSINRNVLQAIPRKLSLDRLVINLSPCCRWTLSWTTADGTDW